MRRKVKVHPKRRRKRRPQSLAILLLVAIFLILILLILFFSKSGIRIPFFPNTGPENIAFKRPVYASSNINTTNTALQAVDGNQTTLWHSTRSFPASLTVSLDHNYSVNKIILKLPATQGPKSQTIEVLGSLDNILFTRIVAPKSYYFSPTVTINFTPVVSKYIRLVISTNSQTTQAQIAEFEVYAMDPHWKIQSFDVMKYSKDVVCNPPSPVTINTMNDRIASAGANMVAISTPYDNPECGSSVNLTNSWIASARTRNLHIWHRHMSLSFEGIYGVAKAKDLTLYTKQIVEYIASNSAQFQDGDIFTPTPEPDSAGIFGVTYCFIICQFSSADEYNIWIQTTQAAVKAAFFALHKNVKVGYYGHSSFIVWGENNPDWMGKSFLTQATVDSMDGVIAMDTYPDFYGGNMDGSLIGAHARWPNVHLVVGEWGTVTVGTDDQKKARIIEAMSASEKSYIDGFNYWNLGPAGNEGVIDESLNPLPPFQTIKDFYTGLR